MYVCPQCASSTDLSQFPERRTCPDCGTPVRNDENRPAWIDVARVANLAEAGFLTDELVGMGIDARIHQLDEFRAAGDHWVSMYLIRVPIGAEHEAALHLRQHMADESGEDESDSFRFDPNSPPNDAMWRPVALVVLAGVASFVLGQQFSDHNADGRARHDSLPRAIDDIGRPLTTEPAPGKPRFRLAFDGRREVWLLDADRDGDGRYDERAQYHASGAAW